MPTNDVPVSMSTAQAPSLVSAQKAVTVDPSVTCCMDSNHMPLEEARDRYVRLPPAVYVKSGAPSTNSLPSAEFEVR